MLFFHWFGLSDDGIGLPDGRTVSFLWARPYAARAHPRAAAAYLSLLAWAGWEMARLSAVGTVGQFSTIVYIVDTLLDMLLLECFLCHTATDILYYRLTDRINGLIYPASCLLRVSEFMTAEDLPSGAGTGDWTAVLWGMVLGAATPAVLMLWMDGIAPGSFGFGDIKFCLAAGPMLGLSGAMEALLAALLAAGAYGAALLVFRRAKKEERFALGPFLMAGYLWIVIAG